MKYALKNLKTFCKTERMVFFLAILSVFTSMAVLLFALGIYQNYKQELLDKESDTKDLYITFSKDESTGEYVTQAQLKKSLQELSDLTTSQLYGIVINESVEGADKEDVSDGYEYLKSFLIVSHGKIKRCDNVIDNFEKSKLRQSGEWWSEKQEESGDLCAFVAPISTKTDYNTKSAYNDNYLSKDGKTVQIQGNTYQVVGMYGLNLSPIVPFLSLRDDTEMVQIEMGFNFAISMSQYNDIKNVFVSNMGDLVHMPELTLYDSDNTKLNTTVMYISILIAALAAINFAVLYHYILIQRKRKLTIFQLCGCTRSKVIIMYLLECQILSIPIMILAILCYHWMILPHLTGIFPYIGAFYSWQVYVELLLLDVLITTLILLLMIVRNVHHEIRQGFIR